MFDECTSLAELNAARTRAVQGGADVVAVNNAYNERRKEILASRVNYFKLKEMVIAAEPAQTTMGLPIRGSSGTPGVIKITMEGIAV